MSISNLLEDNPYDLYCRTLTPSYRFNPSRTTTQFRFLSSSQAIADSDSVPSIVVYTALSPQASDAAPLPYTYVNGVFTMTRGAMVIITAQVRWAANVTGSRVISLRRNADAYTQISNMDSGAMFNNIPAISCQSFCWSGYLGATATFQVEVLQNSGGSLNILGVSQSPNYFSNISISTIY